MQLKITESLEHVSTVLDKKTLTKVAYDAFKKATPVLTGRAKNSTTYSADTIFANYPYAQSLNQGSSPKAPEGMTPSAIEAVREYIKQETNIEVR